MTRSSLLTGFAVFALIAVALCVGTVPLNPWEALDALRGDPGTAPTRLLLLHVRLPRVLVAWLAGAALSVAGSALQGMFRNPLADPSVLGVSAGAALGAQALLYVGGTGLLVCALPLASCAGALIATLILLGIVGGGHRGGVETLILAGVALGQMAVAASTLLLSFALADYTVAQRLLRWALGSLDGRTWVHVAWCLPTLVGSGWVWRRARQLDALTLGDTTARSLGVSVTSLRRELVVAVALLSGITVAVAGVVGFVGLVVPHLVRRWAGAAHGALVPRAWWVGGATLVAADCLARVVIAPAELQLGAVTAAVGTPWFVVVFRRHLRELPA